LITVDKIMQEVERRVAERLPARLLVMGVYHHTKHGFKVGCQCTYCDLKREATARIGGLRHSDVVTTPDYDDEDRYYLARGRLKLKYREALRKLRDE
jgi:hypothetical protein